MRQLAGSLTSIVCKQRKSTLSVELASKTLCVTDFDTRHGLASHLGDGAGASEGGGVG